LDSAFRGRRKYPAVAELDIMTNTELMDVKAALEAKRLELAAQLSGRIRELTIEDGQQDLID
jgi:hypothetical protein